MFQLALITMIVGLWLTIPTVDATASVSRLHENDFLAQTPNVVVARVNGMTIPLSQFQAAVRLERAIINERLQAVVTQSQLWGDQASDYLLARLQQDPYATWLYEIQHSAVIGERVLMDMVEDRLIEGQAQMLGITIQASDLQAVIVRHFNDDLPLPGNTVTPVPTLSPAEQAEVFAQLVESHFASIAWNAVARQDDVMAYFKRKALRMLVAHHMTADSIATTDFEVQVRHILVATEPEAVDILAELSDGASFTALAQARSLDTGSAEQGGTYDWAPPSVYIEPFADAVKVATVGEVFGPVETEFGFHIIEVQARREVPLPAEQIDRARDRAFGLILDDLVADERNRIEIDPIWVDFVPAEPVFTPYPESDTT